MATGITRIDSPVLDIADSAYCHKEQLLFFLDDDRLCTIPLENLERLTATKPLFIYRDLLVRAEECSMFSIPDNAMIGAYVDYEETLNLLELNYFKSVLTIDIEDEGDAVSVISVSPDASSVVFLEELDREEQALLLYQWKLLNVSTGAVALIPIFGDADIRMPRLIGWWSDHIVCFTAPNGLVFWDVRSSAMKTLAVPEPYVVVDAVFDAERPFGCLNLESADGGKSVVCLVELKDNGFKLTKLLESYKCLGWKPQGEQIFVCSSSGFLGRTDLNSRRTEAICKIETDFDNAFVVDDDLVLLVGETFISLVSE